MPGDTHQPSRQWRVLLLGGAAGTGKTSVSHSLARHFGVGITEVDDLHNAVMQMTTPEQQPVLHYWTTHPEAYGWTAERILELHLAVGEVLSPALEAVVADHVAFDNPALLEGDYLLPALAARTADKFGAGAVHAVFLYEPEETQIIRNFSAREPEAGEQTKRARVSWLYGQWLREEAARVNVPALPARPWDTLQGRVLAALGS